MHKEIQLILFYDSKHLIESDIEQWYFNKSLTFSTANLENSNIQNKLCWFSVSVEQNTIIWPFESWTLFVKLWELTGQ